MTTTKLKPQPTHTSVSTDAMRSGSTGIAVVGTKYSVVVKKRNSLRR